MLLTCKRYSNLCNEFYKDNARCTTTCYMHEGLRPVLRTQHPFAIYENITCNTTGSVYIWKSHEFEPPLIPVEPGSSVSGYEIPDCTCLLSSGASPDTWQFSIPRFVRCGLLDFFMRYLTEEVTLIESPLLSSVYCFILFN